VFAWADNRGQGPTPAEVRLAAMAMIVGLGLYAAVGWVALRAAVRRFERDQ
jgi:hypothetical protein